ncbi:MAG: ABC transporter substrate-binding protein [Candidatus Lambdaproteobacteria bacterium]|nr:ABC transporter substrate-binding protein [Candidatus Lambdaproteobacteria bacterium]
MRAIQTITLALAVLAGATLGAAPAVAQKYGGTLQVLIGGNPWSLSLHDESPGNHTVSMSPVYNNLAVFDPFQSRETLATIRPELAKSWAWNAERTALTFELRQGVKWHDGKPFTSRDVKRTFDIARGAATERLKLNPRRLWYANVREITIDGDYEVTFRLKRPQPSLIAMLAAGVSPVMPAHFPAAEWRSKALGSGPFKLKEYQRDKTIVLVKNQEYWVPGRPYLDQVRVNIIQSRATYTAAYLARQLDVITPSAAFRPLMESIRKTDKEVQFQEINSTSMLYVLFNPKQPPFDNARLRLAMSTALDRGAFSKVVLQGGVAIGGVMLPQPTGAWGLTAAQLASLPGYGDVEQNKEAARGIMRELGYGPDKRLRAEMIASSLALYTDFSAWVAASLKDVYVDATVKSMEPGVFNGYLSRREFQIVANAGNIATDDPDTTFYEHYGCGSLRNYNDYCNPALQAKYDEQSQMFDHAERLKLVQEIDARLVTDVARALMGFRINYYPTRPYVKNFVAHQAGYNFWRLQEVWLDK